MLDPALEAARAGDSLAFERVVAPFRRELLAHCYRMSGSMSDAEDLLQESLIRAWKGIGAFEGRSSLRTWLYRLTTNACLDGLDQRRARILPTDLGPPATGAPPPPLEIEPSWLGPCPEAMEVTLSPEARYGARESVALAFLTALQHLPPKQRAVLLLRDVLGWEAAECAALLDTSAASVNSALQRARETVEARARTKTEPPALGAATDEATTTLLARYVRAWELADVRELVSLLHEDATLSMPPLPFWLEGPAAIGASIGQMVFTPEAKGNWRLLATRANGTYAFAGYERDAAGVFQAKAIHVLTIEGARIRAITAFLDPSAFSAFGLATTLP